MAEYGFGVSSAIGLQHAKARIGGEPMPGLASPLATRVKTFALPTIGIRGTIGQTDFEFAILNNPTIAITEVPQGGGLQYYIAFWTFIDSVDWHQDGTFLQFHVFLEDANNTKIYRMDCDLHVSVSCGMSGYYFFDQQALPPNFFDVTENAGFLLDASSHWRRC